MEKQHNIYISFIIVLSIILIFGGCSKSTDDGDSTADINGSVEQINGITVLRLWGSHEEMGYAYGKLLANDLVDLIENFLFGTLIDSLPPGVTYENIVELMNEQILYPESGYLVELQAIVEGIEDTLGELPWIVSNRIESDSAQLSYEMFAIVNASRDLVDLSTGCSSFAAWGSATGDGKTRTGGNMDVADEGQNILSMNYSILIVRKPDYGYATVSSGFIGFIGTSRAMNETGVVTNMQGMETPWVDVCGNCYSALIFRKAIETISSGPNMVDDVVEFFENHTRCGSSNILFAQKSPTWANPTNDQMAAVIEQDYDGITARFHSDNWVSDTLNDTLAADAIIATNHYLVRPYQGGFEPDSSSLKRYNDMTDLIMSRTISRLTDMQAVLQAAAAGTRTTNTMYFEPDDGLIHVAFRSESDPPAPFMTPVTFTWTELFAPVP